MNLLAQLLLSFVAAWLITLWVYRNSGLWNLLQPTNHRSSHLDPTPYCGGIGIVVVSTAGALLAGWGEAPIVVNLFLIAIVLAAVGLADDVWIVSIKARLVVQFVVVGTAIYMTGPLPPVFSGFGDGSQGFGIDEALFYGLVLLTGVWWVNLFNFMDGIDGIASVQALSMLGSAAAMLTLTTGAVAGSVAWEMMLIVAAATAGFLFLNWPPARIFMGDVGSTWLAFVIFALALLSIATGWFSYAVWLILAAVFISDATITLLTRVIQGERWYDAHRTHAYQAISSYLAKDLENRGLNPERSRARAQMAVTMAVLCYNLAWLAPLALAANRLPALALLWTGLAYGPVALAVVLLRKRLLPRNSMPAVHSATGKTRRQDHAGLGFLLITRDTTLASIAHRNGIGRIFVDLEKLGKFERQGHLNTHISNHEIEDVARVKRGLVDAELLVRLNPLNSDTAAEVDRTIADGADILMLPMYREVEEVRRFVGMVDGRARVIPLLETAGAAETLPEVVRIPGVSEIYIGLNDLHLDLGLDFIFEPLANGLVDRLAATIRDAGLPFGFGGVARVDEGIVPGNLVLGEHLRLGSSWVILSRTFHRDLSGTDERTAAIFGAEIGRLRETIAALRLRDAGQVEADRRRLQALVESHVAGRRREAAP